MNSPELVNITKFIDNGHHTNFTPREGYIKIRVHLGLDDKHDRRHRSGLVAEDRHDTDYQWVAKIFLLSKVCRTLSKSLEHGVKDIPYEIQLSQMQKSRLIVFGRQ